MKLTRRFIPAALIVAGVWGPAGCLYVPQPEHPASGQKDFRELIGDPDSRRPIRPNAISRRDVITLLGPPPYSTRDMRSIAYTLRTDQGLYILPLSFDVQPSGGRVYAVRLTFDDRDLLAHCELVHADWRFDLIFRHPFYDDVGIRLLNNNNPEAITAERTDRALRPTSRPQP